MKKEPITKEEVKALLEGGKIKKIDIIDNDRGSDIVIYMKDGTVIEFFSQYDSPVWIIDKTPEK